MEITGGSLSDEGLLNSFALSRNILLINLIPRSFDSKSSLKTLILKSLKLQDIRQEDLCLQRRGGEKLEYQIEFLKVQRILLFYTNQSAFDVLLSTGSWTTKL